jgi:hypothetical protein
LIGRHAHEQEKPHLPSSWDGLGKLDEEKEEDGRKEDQKDEKPEEERGHPCLLVGVEWRDRKRKR